MLEEERHPGPRTPPSFLRRTAIVDRCYGAEWLQMVQVDAMETVRRVNLVGVVGFGDQPLDHAFGIEESERLVVVVKIEHRVDFQDLLI